MYFIMHVPIILDMDVHVMQMIKVKKDFRRLIKLGNLFEQ